MRRKLNSKAMPIILAAAMAMSSLAGCGGGSNPPAEQPTSAPVEETKTEAPTEAPADPGTDAPTEAPVEPEEVEPYTVMIDPATGEAYDLGGINVIIRDWWSDPETIFLNDPKNDYDDARQAYVQWAMDKYNFTITQQGISDWGSTPADYVDYVTSGGDDNNYCWVVRDSPEMAQAMSTGLMYDLSTLDCMDFSDEMFTANKVHEQYTYKGGIYAFYCGMSEPRGGLFINKDIVGEDTVQEIYDAQANDTWTWDMFRTILDKVQKDTDNDGTNDIWGITGNTGGWAKMWACANGGEFVGNSADGYVYKLEDANTMEGLEFCKELLDNYYMPRPEDAQWDYYKQEFLSGTVAFCENGGIYPANPGGEFSEVTFPMAYVMCPKGPSGTLTNIWSNNPHAIPSCYDADTAWKIAFATQIYYTTPAGYEDYNSYVEQLKVQDVLDDRAYDETVPMMSEAAHGMITYDGMIPGLDVGPQFSWNIGPGADISAAVEGVRESWNTFIDQANGN